MGMFGDDGASNDAFDQQIALNQQELEAKRQNLYKTRLEIIKSQGGESWQADKSAPEPNKPNLPFGK